MKNQFVLFMTLALLLMTGACGEKKKVQQEDDSDEWFDQAEYMNRDTTIYGLCSEGSTMHTLQIVTDNGDTLTLDMMTAQEAGHVYGGHAIGDRMAILTNSDKTQLIWSVNLSSLWGDWVMPNPLDGSSEMGFTIRDGGIAESINQSSVVYKTWRLVNGQLEMTSIREGGGDFEESEKFLFLYLSDDSLVFKNEEETFEYARPSKGEDYSDVDFELEEDEDGDIIM